MTARVDVVAENAVDVRVRYGPDAQYTHETPWLALPADGTLSTTLLGLRPDSVTHFNVAVRGPNGSTAATPDLTVTTNPWDPRLPRIKVTFDRSTAGGYVLLAMNDMAQWRGLAAMVDHQGQIVWYRWGGEVQYAVDLLPNGHVIQYRLDYAAFEEVGLDGAVIRTWREKSGNWGADGHDYAFLGGDHAYVFGGEVHPVDTRHIFPGGVLNASRVDNRIDEITPDGTSLWRWSTFSRVSESELTEFDPLEPLDPKAYEIAHLNSIEPLPDGNLWLSLRNTSTVMKVDKRSGDVLWRLGGKHSDFRFVSDPLNGFWRQHDARRLPSGNILLFDNGNLHHPPESRVVEYRLDEAAKTATMVWQYRRAPPLFARVAGSARRLPDGSTLVSYGPLGTVVEVDRDANPVWEITARRFGAYRAVPVPSLYP